MRTIRLSILIIFGLIVSLQQAHAATNSEKIFQRYLDSQLAQIHRFVWVKGFFGTNSVRNDLDIGNREFTNLIILKLRNTLGNMPFVEAPYGTWRPTDGRLTCDVMTVGNSYTVAYHVRCVAGMAMQSTQLWEDAFIGMGGKLGAHDAFVVRLDEMIKDFAGEIDRAKAEFPQHK